MSTNLKQVRPNSQSGQAELKSDVAELKAGQIEIRDGQARLEQEMHHTGRALSVLANDSVRMRAGVEPLEDAQELAR